MRLMKDQDEGICREAAFLFSSHDEIVFECPETSKVEVMEWLGRRMQEDIPLFVLSRYPNSKEVCAVLILYYNIGGGQVLCDGNEHRQSPFNATSPFSTIASGA
jgi:hypothetical protein